MHNMIYECHLWHGQEHTLTKVFENLNSLLIYALRMDLTIVADKTNEIMSMFQHNDVILFCTHTII